MFRSPRDRPPPRPPSRRLTGRAIAAALVCAALAGTLADVGLPSGAPEPATARAASPTPLPPHVEHRAEERETEDEGTMTDRPWTREDRDRLTETIDAYLDETDTRLAVAVHDLTTGATFDYGDDDTFITASIVKVNILVLLLLQAQDDDRELSAEERRLAESMIRYSDNEAADALYARIGYTEGHTAGNELLGLTDTVPGAGSVWGMTETTAADQVRLWGAILDADGPLTEDSREYLRELLSEVAPEQAWGVSAAVGGDGDVELKNGWVPRDSDGRWVVNSTGFVPIPGHDLLIAVLSDGNAHYMAGVDGVEHVVAEVATAMTGEDPRDDVDDEDDAEGVEDSGGDGAGSTV